MASLFEREWVICPNPSSTFVHECGRADGADCYVTSRPGEVREPPRPKFTEPCITDFQGTPKTCGCGVFDLYGQERCG